MRLLLDTHIAIWALTGPELIGTRSRELIADPQNDVFVSAASVWEISIKHGLAARRVAPPFSGADAVRYFSEAGYGLLDVTPAHAAAVEGLPPLHADPFDRMLIAQAMSEPMYLLTADPTVAKYGTMVLLVK